MAKRKRQHQADRKRRQKATLMMDHPFDAAALQHIVAHTLDQSPDVPAGARGAFLTVANADSIKAVIAIRIADQWQVKAVVEHGWGSTTVDYGVSVTGTW